QEEDGDPNPDLAVFNRIGDLYLKVREPAQAADYYDQAVDKYAELGFHNNAIAMCNKVLRSAPGRQTTYLKVAKLYDSKGFIAEPDTSLEIETTSLVDGLDPSAAGGMLEGFETTSAEFGEIQLDAQPAPALQDEVSPDDIPPPAEFEPTMAEEESAPDAAIELEPLLETEIEIEAPVAPVVPKRPGVGAPPRFGGASPKA